MAITVDNTAFGDSSGGSINFYMTISGTQRILWAAIFFNQTGTLFTPTFAGSGMTQVQSKISANTRNGIALFYLINPALGSNLFQTSVSVGSVSAYLVSYNGASPNSVPDSSSTTTQDSSSVSTMTYSTNVVATGCWLVGVCSDYDTSTSAGAGTTIRLGGYGNHQALIDSDGPVGTSTQSLIVNYTTSTNKNAGIIASFAPAAQYTVTAAVSTFSVTGYAALVSKAKIMLANFSSFIVNGFTATFSTIRKWNNQSKNTVTMSDQSKHSSTFSNRTQHKVSVSDQSKHTSTMSDESKHSSIWSNQQHT
jgi:hypothetical protein